MLNWNWRVKWAQIQILVLLSLFCCQDGRRFLVVIYGFYSGNSAQKKREKNQSKEKRMDKGWLANGARKGAYRNILRELKLTDKENYRRYLRMDEATFKVASHSIHILWYAHDILHAQNWQAGVIVSPPWIEGGLAFFRKLAWGGGWPKFLF